MSCLLMQAGFGVVTTGRPAPSCNLEAGAASSCCCCEVASAQARMCSCTDAPAPEDQPSPTAPWSGARGPDLLSPPVASDIRSNPVRHRFVQHAGTMPRVSKMAGRDFAVRVALSVRFCALLI
jgi:hypothetical protein